MASQRTKTEAGQAPTQGGGLPWGLLLGIALGAAIGFATQDLAIGLGLAVAFGICFSFFSPLVRKKPETQTSDDAAEDSDGASSQEKDSK